MARALSAVERREYVRAVIRITRHQGRLTTTEAMKKLGLSRATVQRYFSEAEATGEVVRHGRLGLFRDQRAVIDFDMKRLGMVPKAATFLPRKRPEDGVIVYARTAAAAGIKVEAE
nr:MAG TPA: protein of unknown function (DUF977) [Caudoviricetes sp.]